MKKQAMSMRGGRAEGKSEAVTVQMKRPRLNQMVSAELALCGEPTGEGLSRSGGEADGIGTGYSSGTNALRESNRVGDSRLQADAGLGKTSFLRRLFGLGGVGLVLAGTGILMILS